MKKIMLLFYSILSILSLIILGANSLHAESNSVMFFHYYRFDNNYEEMNVHTWYKDGNPIGDTSFVFENKNDFIINNLDFSFGGYVASVKVGSYFGNIGFIIKRGTLWNDTDISSDRFCDTKWVEKDSNENYHVYIVQGEVNIGISREDKDNNMPDKRYLRSASIIKSDTYIEDNEQLNTFNEIGLSFDYSISYNYEIKDKNNTVLKSGASSNTNEKISLNNILDIESLYFIEITYPSINNYKERRGITLEKI
ncbi:MAG: hypothetical protein LBV51_00410, partial [Acholeplasmatales bacterium]|nr:hypothetical protein [Acholeplasmatales bacterium]